MNTERSTMKTKRDDFPPAKKHAAVTTGEAIRMLRELKGWTQEELARRSGINAKNISRSIFTPDFL